MKYFVNSHEMKAYDKNTIEYFHMPAMVLMERAALSVCSVLKEKNIDCTHTLILCGNGNNGGDGLALARLLALEGNQVCVLYPKDATKVSKEHALQKEILLSYENCSLLTMEDWIFQKETQVTLVVDGVFGIGLTRAISGIYEALFQKINAMSAFKLALDIPSGVSADTGAILGSAFCADLTVSFAYAKTGMLLWPGNQQVGERIVTDIGINEKSWKLVPPEVCGLEQTELSWLPVRPSHSNKGSFGKLLLIAGSQEMAGAAYLAGAAAYAAGCGMVRIFTPKENRTILLTKLPEAILTCYSTETLWEKELLSALQWADAVVCGPGIGLTNEAEQMVHCVLKNAKVPILFDADALTILSKNCKQLLDRNSSVILTPHLGEMSRLCGKTISEIQSSLIETAKGFSGEYQVILALKDERTVIGTPEGKVYLNLSGNCGMATAGAGDVLSGIVGSLLAQGVAPSKAAPLGVYLHGLAGDDMAERIGKRGLIASDLIQGLRNGDYNGDYYER